MEGEYVIVQLFDIGRRIDLNNIISVFPGVRDKKILITKDTDTDISVPETVHLDLVQDLKLNSQNLKLFNVKVKLYEEGVVSFVVRTTFENIDLEQFHTIRKLAVSTDDGTFKIDDWIEFQFNKLIETIKDYIEPYTITLPFPESEKYICYCIHDDLKEPEEFVKRNNRYLAPFLMEENPDLNLHQTQIEKTLEHPFSFLQNDLIIFDLHRCLIIDPTKEYDDILLIIELANYQLLELRTLDKILDIRLDAAEDDIRHLFFKNRIMWRKLNKTLGQLFRYKCDMNFILENLENVSKIIGDYYLAQIYTHLGRLFQVDEWTKSVHSHLQILGDIYTTAKTNLNERILIFLEFLLGCIFTFEFVILLLGLFIK